MIQNQNSPLTFYYENYPASRILMFQFTGILSYTIGFFIIVHTFSNLYAIVYLILCFFANLSVMIGSCTRCYYYGKWCGTGLGKISAKFQRKDPTRFGQTKTANIELGLNALTIAIPLFILLVKFISIPSIKVFIILVALVLSGLLRLVLIKALILCSNCAQGNIKCSYKAHLQKIHDKKFKK